MKRKLGERAVDFAGVPFAALEAERGVEALAALFVNVHVDGKRVAGRRKIGACQRL